MERKQSDGSGQEPDYRHQEGVGPAAVEVTAVPLGTPELVAYDTAGLPLGPPHIVPTEATPSRVVAKYLFDTELYRGEWRRHWIYIARWVTVAVVSPFLAGYLVGLAGDRTPLVSAVVVCWLALLGLVAWKLLDWFFDRFILTDKRVLVISGVVTRKVGMMPLARVTDMAYVQSPLGRVLNYGTFILESAGQDQALREIKPLPHPNRLYLIFCQQMYDPDGTPAPEGEEET